MINHGRLFRKLSILSLQRTLLKNYGLILQKTDTEDLK